MIRLFRKPPLRDPQAGVTFRPWMLIHAGSLAELAPHGLRRLEEAEPPRRSRLATLTLAAAGLLTAFFLGTSWSASPRPVATASCLATAPEAPGQAVGTESLPPR